MTSKRPSVTVIANRFSSKGYTIEQAAFTVNRVGDQVYIHIKGNGPVKDFVMDLGQWRQLEAATKEAGE